jgi:hypothetical protein
MESGGGAMMASVHGKPHNVQGIVSPKSFNFKIYYFSLNN